MKRYIKIVLFILAVCLFSIPVEAMAYSGSYGDFGYNTNDSDGTASIYSYSGSDADVVVPDTINGYTVTRIASEAFKNKNIESIELPDTIKSIGDYAFTNCRKLKKVTFSEGLTTLGLEMFHNCDSLTTITLPGSVTTIPYSSFRMCTGLKTITIPDTVTTVEENAFVFCTNLTSVKWSKNAKVISERTFSQCSKLERIDIPYGVTEIGSGAFDTCGSLKNIKLPDSVSKIGGSAFSKCTSLQSITIPKLVKNIESNTFTGCTSLRTIVALGSTDFAFYNSDGVYDNVTVYCVPFSDAHKSFNGKKIVFGTPDKTYRVDISKYASTAVYSGVNDKTYSGEPIEQKEGWLSGFGLQISGCSLYRNSDFSYRYENNVNAGTATIVITGKGNYEGILKKTFRILPLTIDQESDNTVVSGITDQKYTGKKIVQSGLTVMRDGVKLVKNRDFTVGYKNNVMPGKVTVEIKGKGNYQGRIVRTYSISIPEGAVYTVGYFRYKVTGNTSNAKTVSLTGTTYSRKNSAFTALTVPAKIKIGGVSFTVTSIGANAFSGYSRLKTVKTGQNIRKIGAKAFYRCSRLSTVTISSKRLSTIGAKAFAGINKRAVVKLPKTKYTTYRKLFSKSSAAKTLKYKKYNN